MFRVAALFIAFLTFSFFIGCDEKSTEPTEEKPSTLLPLALGNTWNYKLYNQSSDSTGQVIWSVNSIINVDGKDYFLITSTGFGNNYFAARIESDGLFLSIYDSTNGFVSPFFYKYPAEDNETYQYIIPNTDSTLFITVKKQNLLINNYNYHCYGYINQNLNPYFPFMYFSENIGLVRHKLVFNTGQGIDTTRYFIYDLQNKKLNK